MRTYEIIICFILICISIIRFLFFIPKPPLVYNNYIDKKISLTGVIIDAPDVRLKDQRLVVRPEGSETNLLVVTNLSNNFSYGDKINLEGVLEEPENFITKQEKIFNYKRYLSNKDIYFILDNPKITIMSSGHGFFIKRHLFSFRQAFLSRISKIISQKESYLASGLLLGSRGGFDTETKEEFINTGTIHIVALSGYNVSLIAFACMRILLLFFSLTFSVCIGIVALILFVIMSGASATAVRAGIMASLVLFSRMSGRLYSAGRALVIALLLMCVYDLRVLSDVSFQLSFIATFGLLFITPKIVPYFMWVSSRFEFRNIITTTIACTIAVLPILIYTTGVLSLVSIPANIVVLPLVPISMFLSFLATISSYIFLPLGILFGYIASFVLALVLKIIHIFSLAPFASLIVKDVSIHFVLICYIWILWWVFKENKNSL